MRFVGDLMQRIRVLIVDDHAIVREGLRAIMESRPDIEVVGEAADGEAALAKVTEFRPDVVLMDITMPRMNGLEATRRIKQTDPNTKILVLTMHEEDDYFFKILEAGASGYFVKGGSSQELLTAVRSVSQGNAFIYPTMAKRLLVDYLQRAGSGHDLVQQTSLSNREQEILRLVADGRSNQEIGDLLFLSPATVQTHRAHIMAKLGLHNRTELVKYALRQGFITLDE